MSVIVSPRPPLNIFDVRRLNLSGDSWVTLLRTHSYLIPAIGPNPERPIQVVSLLTSLIVTNSISSTIDVSLRVVASGGEFTLLNQLPVPVRDFAVIELSKQNLPSGEELQIRLNAGQTGVAHLSFVSNQREEYEEL